MALYELSRPNRKPFRPHLLVVMDHYGRLFDRKRLTYLVRDGTQWATRQWCSELVDLG